jgi:sulfur relay (sulfurtransferase) complex TusBCD TusD component (DsrE family)
MPTSVKDLATVIVVARDGMGEAPAELRHKLIKSYLSLLLKNDMLPRVICFYGAGVHQVGPASPVIEELRALESRGVRLVVCSTCASFFGMVDAIQVGLIGGMGDILEAQWKADKVIAL